MVGAQNGREKSIGELFGQQRKKYLDSLGTSRLKTITQVNRRQMASGSSVGRYQRLCANKLVSAHKSSPK